MLLILCVFFCFFQACAPRYVFFTVQQVKDADNNVNRSKNKFGNLREPVGTCWVTNLTSSIEYSPCRTCKYLQQNLLFIRNHRFMLINKGFIWFSSVTKYFSN